MYTCRLVDEEETAVVVVSGGARVAFIPLVPSSAASSSAGSASLSAVVPSVLPAACRQTADIACLSAALRLRALASSLRLLVSLTANHRAVDPTPVPFVAPPTRCLCVFLRLRRSRRPLASRRFGAHRIGEDLHDDICGRAQSEPE